MGTLSKATAALCDFAGRVPVKRGRQLTGAMIQRRRLSRAAATILAVAFTGSCFGSSAKASLDVSPVEIVTSSMAGGSNALIYCLIAVGALALLSSTVFALVAVRLLRRQRAKTRQLGVAIDNMTQGLLLFDSSKRLIVCNRRFIDMYGLSTEVMKPGISLRGVVVHRKESGSFLGDVDEYCARAAHDTATGKAFVSQTGDGRFVRIANQPLRSGGWVVTHEDITEQRVAEDRIARMAHHDALTDLPNRVLFRAHLQSKVERAAQGEKFALFFIDVDEFKSINDSFGHAVGDEIIKTVASCLRDCIRSTDFAARVGGDEFAVVQSPIEHPADVEALVNRIYAAIRKSHDCLGHRLSADASIGIALAPQDGCDIEQLLKNADLAMYKAKSDGRRTYRFFDRSIEMRAASGRSPVAASPMQNRGQAADLAPTLAGPLHPNFDLLPQAGRDEEEFTRVAGTHSV